MDSLAQGRQSEAVLSHLRAKAAALPRLPGVYVMRAASGKGLDRRGPDRLKGDC